MKKYDILKTERFHSMYARVETVCVNDGMTVKRLVSYGNVVCDMNMDTRTVYLYHRYQYGSVTVRHVTRFLNEFAPLAYGQWTIALIRYTQDNSDSDGHATLCKYDVCFRDYVLGTQCGW